IAQHYQLGDKAWQAGSGLAPILITPDRQEELFSRSGVAEPGRCLPLRHYPFLLTRRIAPVGGREVPRPTVGPFQRGGGYKGGAAHGWKRLEAGWKSACYLDGIWTFGASPWARVVPTPFRQPKSVGRRLEILLAGSFDDVAPLA